MRTPTFFAFRVMDWLTDRVLDLIGRAAASFDQHLAPLDDDQ